MSVRVRARTHGALCRLPHASGPVPESTRNRQRSHPLLPARPKAKNVPGQENARAGTVVRTMSRQRFSPLDGDVNVVDQHS